MSDKTPPKTGQKIIISEKRKDGSERDYISQVLQVKDSEHYRIAVPISKGTLVTLMNGTKISLVYALENAGMFSFDAKIVSKTRDENIPLMDIQRVGEIVKDQRRNYFRIPLVIPINIIKSAELETIECYSKDLSGGGIRFISNREFYEGELVMIKFTLENMEFTIQGSIIRKYKSTEPQKFEAAAEFLDINESDQNQIISHLFHKQRLMIKMR